MGVLGAILGLAFIGIVAFFVRRHLRKKEQLRQQQDLRQMYETSGSTGHESKVPEYSTTDESSTHQGSARNMVQSMNNPLPPVPTYELATHEDTRAEMYDKGAVANINEMSTNSEKSEDRSEDAQSRKEMPV